MNGCIPTTKEELDKLLAGKTPVRITSLPPFPPDKKENK
jgi:hypothetical protein